MTFLSVTPIDLNGPTVQNCPQSITVETIGTTSAVVTWDEPTATDDSGIPPTVTRSHQPGQSFPVGTQQVTYTFTDQAGNQATCSFTVTGKYCGEFCFNFVYQMNMRKRISILETDSHKYFHFVVGILLLLKV